MDNNIMKEETADVQEFCSKCHKAPIVERYHNKDKVWKSFCVECGEETEKVPGVPILKKPVKRETKKSEKKKETTAEPSALEKSSFEDLTASGAEKMIRDRVKELKEKEKDLSVQLNLIRVELKQFETMLDALELGAEKMKK